jgi:hypothetical protein
MRAGDREGNARRRPPAQKRRPGDFAMKDVNLVTPGRVDGENGVNFLGSCAVSTSRMAKSRNDNGAGLGGRHGQSLDWIGAGCGADRSVR